jgi:hypothetical protein
MRMRIFKGGDLQALESKINEWLQTEGIGEVRPREEIFVTLRRFVQ